MPQSCWTSRYDAHGYADALEMAIYYGFRISEEACEDICLLPMGHTSDHEYTPTCDIVIELKVVA